jgi:hypothetical protein
MAKRPDTLETVKLALELLRRIPRNRKISASELREQLANTGFARDLRTIQRQLEILSEHFDIERDDASKPYGYRWKERAEGLSLPGLSEQESLLLALAEQHLRNLLPENLLKSMDGFLQAGPSESWAAYGWEACERLALQGEGRECHAAVTTAENQAGGIRGGEQCPVCRLLAEAGLHECCGEA